MGNLLSPAPTPRQMVQENQKNLRKNIRELEREIEKMQQTDAKTVYEIKQLAQKGQVQAAKISAKELIRTRNAVSKFYATKSQLSAVSNRLTQIQTTAAMGEAMRDAARAMQTLNRQMNLPRLQKTMYMFEKEGEILEMKQEIMDDTIDSVMAGENDDEQEEEALGQIFDEIGINLTDLMGSPLATVPGGGKLGSTQLAN